MIYPLTFQHSQNVPCEKKSIIVDNYLNVKFNIQYLFLSTNFEINFSAVDSHRSLSKQEALQSIPAATTTVHSSQTWSTRHIPLFSNGNSLQCDDLTVWRIDWPPNPTARTCHALVQSDRRFSLSLMQPIL